MKKKIAFVTAVVFIALWMALGYSNNKLLREDHILTYGTVSSVERGGKGNRGPEICYTYFVNSEEKKGLTLHRELKYGIHQFVGKSFPVVYRHGILGYDYYILVTPNDFRRYGYEFPDTLNWALEYIRSQ